MFKIVDTKTGRIAFDKVSEYEARKRVALLNSCGIIRYEAQRI